MENTCRTLGELETNLFHAENPKSNFPQQQAREENPGSRFRENNTNKNGARFCCPCRANVFLHEIPRRHSLCSFCLGLKLRSAFSRIFNSRERAYSPIPFVDESADKIAKRSRRRNFRTEAERNSAQRQVREANVALEPKSKNPPRPERAKRSESGLRRSRDNKTGYGFLIFVDEVERHFFVGAFPLEIDERNERRHQHERYNHGSPADDIMHGAEGEIGAFGRVAEEV